MNHESSHKVVETDSWVLSVPDGLDRSAPLVCIPTIHPRGDRRVLRCAQVALDSGFRLCFIWLGEGRPSTHPLVEEIVLPTGRSFADRIRQIRHISRQATEVNPAAWHIHDYYFLHAARRWHRRTGRPVVYDVHEYYADYYSAKLPLPGVLRRAVARMLENYQVGSARIFGGANVVTPEMGAPFEGSSVPLAVTPNYPFRGPLDHADLVHFRDRRHAVLHMGMLNEEYGSDTLLALSRRSQERGLPFRFDAVARFASEAAERDFRLRLGGGSDEAPLRLVSARAAHEMPRLLAEYGFGLSLLKPRGQNLRAVPAKNFEHLLMALVPVVTDLPAQAAFVRGRGGPCVVLDIEDLDACLDQMLVLAADPEGTDEELVRSAVSARQHLTWEGASAPQLARLYRDVFQDV